MATFSKEYLSTSALGEPTLSTSTQVLQSDGDGTTSWVAASAGDVTGVTAGTLIDVTDPTGPVPTINVDLSEAATSTSDGDGDYFIVTDAAAAQHKLTKGNIALSGFNNDSGFAAGTVTAVSGTAPVVSSGGSTPAISVATSSDQFILSNQVFSG